MNFSSLLRIPRRAGPDLVSRLAAGNCILPAKLVQSQNGCDLKIDPGRARAVAELLTRMLQDPLCKSSLIPTRWLTNEALTSGEPT